MADFSDPTAEQPEEGAKPGDTQQVEATGNVRTLNRMFAVHVKMPGKPVKVYGAAIGGGGNSAEAVAAVYEKTNPFPGAESVEIHEVADAPPANVKAILNGATPGFKMRPKTKLLTPKPTIVRLHDKMAGLGLAPDGSPLQNKAAGGLDASQTDKTQENDA